METKLNDFYLQKEEPQKGCLLSLRKIILEQDPEITNVLKYGMPFFCYKGKMFCYLWVQQSSNNPYIGIVEGKYFDNPELVAEKRSRMKIMLLNPEKDLPIEVIKVILRKAINLYKSGEIKIK